MHVLERQKLACFVVGATLIGGGRAQDCPPSWDGASGQISHPSQDISALAVFDDGSGPAVYLGGYFGLQSNPEIGFLARWDGYRFSSVGGGLSNSVDDLCVYDDGEGPALYATGFFSSAEGRLVRLIAKWDGNRWSALGGGLGGPFAIGRTLAVFDDGRGPALYVGGSFETAGGAPASNIARWDGSTWEPLGSGLNAACYSLSVFDDGNGPRLYAGGVFGFAGGIRVNGIARWNGSAWSGVGGGLSHPSTYGVGASAVFDDGAGNALYVGGQFTAAGGVPAMNLAKWDGVAWSSVGDPNVAVSALCGLEGSLYVGGGFTEIGGVAASAVARWDGKNWNPLDEGVVFQGGCCTAVKAFAPYDADPHGPSLYVGGNFNYAGGLPAVSLARWGCPYLLGDVTCDGSVNIFDIDAFVLALTSPAGYAAAWPDCFLSRADANNDGSVNQFDIQFFIDLLLTP